MIGNSWDRSIAKPLLVCPRCDRLRQNSSCCRNDAVRRLLFLVLQRASIHATAVAAFTGQWVAVIFTAQYAVRKWSPRRHAIFRTLARESPHARPFSQLGCTRSVARRRAPPGVVGDREERRSRRNVFQSSRSAVVGGRLLKSLGEANRLLAGIGPINPVARYQFSWLTVSGSSESGLVRMPPKISAFFLIQATLKQLTAGAAGCVGCGGENALV